MCEGTDVPRFGQGKFNGVLQSLGCHVSLEEQERLLGNVAPVTEEAVDERLFGELLAACGVVVRESMPADEACAQSAFISPTSMW
eukprot:10455675-Lingulodinium_polyedra.AAC.1